MTREEAITAIKTWIGCMRKTYNNNEFAMEFVNGAETLMKEALKQPEIVHCKDCKYSKNNYLVNGLILCKRHIYARDGAKASLNIVMTGNDYCSLAERKECL